MSIKLSTYVKKLPSLEETRTRKWYVVFVGTVNNINGMEAILQSTELRNTIVWAPTFQEYCKVRSHLILVDRLLYPGYTFIGLETDHQLGLFLKELSDGRKGIMLGEGRIYLESDEIRDIVEVASRFCDAPKVMFDVHPGDSVTISSGPLSGLPAIVQDIKTSGEVTLTVFFLSRELSVKTSVLDIQSFGYAYDAEHD